MPAIGIGDRAPDLGYTDTRGEPRRLAELWAQGPALVLWLRHFGWPFYSEALAQVREQRSRLDALGLRVACVVQGGPAEAQRFCGRHGVEDVCVPDPARASYRAMGLERTSWGALLRPSPDLKRRRGEAQSAGCGISLRGTFQKHTDILQLPGAALIARGGEILWLHQGAHPGDLPSVERLLELARERLGSTGARGLE